VSYVVEVPDPASEQITSWGLSLETEEEMYRVLQEELAHGHQEKCSQHAAPAPTFVFDLVFQDPVVLGIVHACTFWLTYGEKDNTLYVRHCTHKQAERW
jgi:hypothetical protein